MQPGPAWAQPVRLRQVLPDAVYSGTDDLWVGSCSHDSRRIGSGDLFVALPGTLHDGRQFAEDAVARGCSAVLAQEPIAGLNVPVVSVPDVRNAYAGSFR